jgi:hypothetical protein
MVFIPAEVANGVINIIDSCTFEVSSFSFAAPYDNDYEWYGFKGDEPTGIPISVSNVYDSTSAKIEYILMDGVTFEDFDKFVLFDLGFNIPVAEANMLPSTAPVTSTPPTTTSTPPTASSSASITSMSPTSESPPAATYTNGNNADTGNAKPDCTTTADSKVAAATDNAEGKERREEWKDRYVH